MDDKHHVALVLHVFMAGDDARAKANVSSFIESLGLRPRDVGDVSMAHWLEGAGLLSVGLARNGVGSLNFSLGATAQSWSMPVQLMP